MRGDTRPGARSVRNVTRSKATAGPSPPIRARRPAPAPPGDDLLLRGRREVRGAHRGVLDVAAGHLEPLREPAEVDVGAERRGLGDHRAPQLLALVELGR